MSAWGREGQEAAEAEDVLEAGQGGERPHRCPWPSHPVTVAEP